MDSLRRQVRIDGHTAEAAAMAESRSIAPAPAFRLDVMRSLRLHPRIAVVVGIASFVFIAGYALTRKPTYEAQSLSYVEPLATKVVSDGSQGIFDPARYDSYIQQQIQTAQREDILEAAIAKLPADTWQRPGEDIHDAAERLSNSLKVQRVGTSYQLAISLTGEDPGKTAAVVNAATNAYLEQGRKDENARSDGRLTLLQDESQRIQKELQQDRDEQAMLSRTLGVADTQTGGANPYDMQLAGVRTELVAAREAHDVAAAQLASVTSGSGQTGLKVVADEALANDTGLSSLKATINQRRAMLNSQMAGLTPSNPVYQQDVDELADLDRQLDLRTTQLRQVAARRVEDKLRLDLQRTGDVEARLNAQLAQATALAGTAAPKLQRAQELSADITRLQARYTTVDDALRGLELESNGPGTAHLLVAAEVPTAPAANHRMLLLVLAFPLSLMAAIGAAVLARKRDPRLYTGHDVEGAVGVPALSVIPSSYEVSDRVYGEYLLRLAAGLERGYRTSGASSFVLTPVSSSMEIGGLVQALEDKLKELGFKVATIEASEVRRTVVEERRSRQRGPSTQSDHFVAMRATKGESHAINKLERLKQHNNFVLIYAEPLLKSADAEYAASSADATLLIVESGETTGEELKKCVLLLQRLRASGVGAIVQNVRASVSEPEFRSMLRLVDSDAAESWERSPKTIFRDPEAGVRGVVTTNIPERMFEEKVHEKRAAFVPDQLAAVEREEVKHETVSVSSVVVPVQISEPVRQEAKQTETAQNHEVVRFVEPESAKFLSSVVQTNQSQRTTAFSAKEEAIARVKAKFENKIFLENAITPEEKRVNADEPVSRIGATPAEKPVVQQPSAPRMIFWNAKVKSSVANELAAEAVAPAEVVPSPTVQPILQSAISNKPPVVDLSPSVATTAQSEPIKAEEPAPTATPVKPIVTHPAARQPIHTVTDPPLPVRSTVIPWAPRPERRRKPRDPGYPHDLNKSLYAMQPPAQAQHGVLAGSRLPAAEQAVARAVAISQQQEPAARLMREKPGSAGRWGLLRRFDPNTTSEDEVLKERQQDRAAG